MQKNPELLNFNNLFSLFFLDHFLTVFKIQLPMSDQLVILSSITNSNLSQSDGPDRSINLTYFRHLSLDYMKSVLKLSGQGYNNYK